MDAEFKLRADGKLLWRPYAPQGGISICLTIALNQNPDNFIILQCIALHLRSIAILLAYFQ